MPATDAQLEAIRDQWLAPLLAQIAEQAERIGRLAAERDAARVAEHQARRWAEIVSMERDHLRATMAPPRQDAAHGSPARTSEADDLSPLGRLRRAWRAIRRP